MDSSAEASRKSGPYAWVYLAVLLGVCAAVITWAAKAAQDPQGVLADDTTPTTAVTSDLNVVDLNFEVDGDSVTLRGAVPDEGAHQTLLASAQSRYATVNDELVVDAATSLVGGKLSVSGTAFEQDRDAAGLQLDAASSLGLTAAAFDVTFVELDKMPVAATVTVNNSTVAIAGSFPDLASADQFVLAVKETFGADAVDSSAVAVDPETTLTNSTITVGGLIDAGDLRGVTLLSNLGVFFGSSNVDATALAFDTSPLALGRLEARLRAQLGGSPILFASGSSTIEEASLPLLDQLAVAIKAAPGVPVTIAGHTDSSGDAGTNQILSEDRANAVREQLVTFGVDPTQLTAVGIGEAQPVADNESEEGKAANRRIEFEFEGAVEVDNG